MTKEEFEKMQKLMEEERFCTTALEEVDAVRDPKKGVSMRARYYLVEPMCMDMDIRLKVADIIAAHYQERLDKAREEMAKL